MTRVISKVVVQPALSVTLKVIKFDTRIQIESAPLVSYITVNQHLHNSLERERFVTMNDRAMQKGRKMGIDTNKLLLRAVM